GVCDFGNLWNKRIGDCFNLFLVFLIGEVIIVVGVDEQIADEGRGSDFFILLKFVVRLFNILVFFLLEVFLFVFFFGLLFLIQQVFVLKFLSSLGGWGLWLEDRGGTRAEIRSREGGG